MAAAVEEHHFTTHDDQDEERLMIFSLAHQCRWWLKYFSRHLGSSTTWQQHLSTIDDSQGRFSVWANNIGALRDPKSSSSLDYRLRDGGQMRKSVIQALVDIKEAVEQGNFIAAGALPNRTDEASEIFENADGDDELPVTTELDELLSSIQSSVDRLFRLSMLIRRKRPQGRLPAETGALVTDPSMDIRHVKDKFPKVKETEWLAERLGTAIAKRRAFICYRQLHHQHLAEPSQDSAEDSKARSRRAPSTIATTYDEGSIDIEQQVTKLSGLSTVTGATSFATAFGSDENGDLRVPDLTRLKSHGTQLEYNSSFECPFCRTIQVVSSEREWRSHVFADLRPYVCTFEGCTSDSFSSRHEWFNHELEFHRKQWHCLKCHNGKFTSASRLREHFDSTHLGSFTNVQWPLILKACERPLKDYGPSSCPFCFYWVLPEGKIHDAEEFCRHVGSHVQQLALTALPIAIEGLDFLEDEDKDTLSDTSGNGGDAEGVHYSDVPGPDPDLHVLQARVPQVVINEQTDTFEYIVEAHFAGTAHGGWQLMRAYGDFYDLQISLLTTFPREGGQMGNKRTLPYMPGPVNHVTMPIAEGRRFNLDAYLCNLIGQPAYISRSKLVEKFFTPRSTDVPLRSDT